MKNSKGVLRMAFSEKLFDENFTFSFKTMVASNINIATQAFDLFWEKNAIFLSGANELYGRILGYAVNQQFKNSALSTASEFLVSDKEVNTYKTKAVFLNTRDYITSIGRTEKPLKLPCKAAYKLKLAQGNKQDNAQIEMFVDEGNEKIFGPPKKYAFIGYRYINGELKHLNIIVPDEGFNGIIYSSDLTNHMRESYKYLPEEIIEENITSLKEHIVIEAKKQKLIK